MKNTPYFLYISEVFCPWCYGFSPVIAKIKEKYGLQFKVVCGALMEEPVSFKSRFEKVPNIQAFIERMYQVTKVKISQDYLKLLYSEENDKIFYNSQKGALLFYSLKSFIPDKALEIMKELQQMLYHQGLDVLNQKNQENLAKKLNINFQDLLKFMQDEENQEKSLAETEESFEIMADVVLYPTLYYVDENEKRHFVSRGFVEYENCVAKIEQIINADKELSTFTELNIIGKACSLDGICE